MQKKNWILWDKIQILSCFDLTEFFITFITLKIKFWEKKLVTFMLSFFSDFWINSKLYLYFLHNLALSGAEKYKIWNLGMKSGKFELWNMLILKVWFFPKLTLEIIETYLVELSTVIWFKISMLLQLQMKDVSRYGQRTPYWFC